MSLSCLPLDLGEKVCFVGSSFGTKSLNVRGAGTRLYSGNRVENETLHAGQILVLFLDSPLLFT